MDLGEELMVAGIGCREGVSGEQVEAAIEAALAALRAQTAAQAVEAQRQPRRAAHAESGHTAKGLQAIATPAAKATETGIRAAAASWGVPLLAIDQADLEAAGAATVTRSARSMAAMNVHSVAEAAALAGAAQLANAAFAAATADQPRLANPTPRLLQPRIAAGPVTCALADTTTP
jgi:cobalt-precorrin 5A hydrolase